MASQIVVIYGLETCHKLCLLIKALFVKLRPSSCGMLCPHMDASSQRPRLTCPKRRLVEYSQYSIPQAGTQCSFGVADGLDLGGSDVF